MEKKNAAVDRISDLPNEILHHILCFRETTKEVVQTSLLSRRWRYVWKSVPVLNFDNNFDNSLYLSSKFNNFVDSILLGLVDLNIMKFQLRMVQFCDTQNLKNWLNIALKHQVREVHLQFPNQKPVKLPRFRFPITQLITLQLENVELPDAKPNGHSSVKLPWLENLVLINCKQKHLKVFNISCIRLKNLVINNHYGSVGHCKIKISTPNLISFKCIDGMYEDYILVNLSSIASVEFIGYIADRHNSQSLTNALLRGFCNATSLQLSPVWFEPTFESRQMRNFFDPFCNLKYVNMAINSSGCIHALAIFLTNSPQLKRVILDLFEAKDKPEDEDWNENLPFIDKHNNLKAIEIQNCKCSEDELKVLQYVLKNTTVLRKITFSFERKFFENLTDSGMKKKVLKDFRKKLRSLERASSQITTLFYHHSPIYPEAKYDYNVETKLADW